MTPLEASKVDESMYRKFNVFLLLSKNLYHTSRFAILIHASNHWI